MAKKKRKPTWFDCHEDKALDLLVDFYNLRLKIIYPPDVKIYSDGSYSARSKDGHLIVVSGGQRPKLDISDSEFKKITRFFENRLWLGVLPPITGRDFDEKFPHPYRNFDKLKYLYDHPEDAEIEVGDHVQSLLDIQLHLYTAHRKGSPGEVRPYFERALWRESEGFQAFLYDCHTIIAIVKEALEKRVLSVKNQRWIENLGDKLHQTTRPRLLGRPKSNRWGDFHECHTEDGSIDLDKANVIEISSLLCGWYGLDFGAFVYFIYKGVVHLLGDVNVVRQCPVCQVLFVNHGRGRPRKFCEPGPDGKCYREDKAERDREYMREDRRKKKRQRMGFS